jgi:hypothetical protein
MTKLRRIAILTICLAVITLPGCKKKPTAVAVQQPPAPQVTPTPEQTPQPAPGTQTQSQGTPPPESTPSPSEAEAQPTPSDADKAKTANKPRTPAKKPTETARNNKPRIVVKPEPEPSSTPGVISPSISSDAGQEQSTTDQILQKTENNLNGIKRQLTPEEQGYANQIRDYMKQSREATKRNDLVGARNLAIKAQLLCDELVKKR